MNLAPIVLFVYNRPEHTLKTLEALKKNELAEKSILYIFCDGAKINAKENDLLSITKVREVVKTQQWCKEVKIIEQKENFGLAKSIIEGVTKIVNLHGKIIVLEDDILTSVGFLKYMNDALSFYEKEDKVMHISGFMYPHKQDLPETFFFNVPLCWGWATWKKSWSKFNNNSIGLWEQINNNNLKKELDKFGSDYLSSQLAHNISGKLDTWFIKWHASVLLENGFTLYPKISLVDNIGFDNTGVHNGRNDEFKNSILAKEIRVDSIDVIESVEAVEIIKYFYSGLKSINKPRFKRRFKTKLKYLFYDFFPELKKAAQDIRKVDVRASYLGNHTKIYPSARINNSIIGNYSYIAENSVINNTTIGKFCSIGPNLISGWGIHPTDGVSTHPMFYSTKKQNGITICEYDKITETMPVKIGNDVFIGMNVTILDGVKIGDGAIIGAGAIVSKNIPPYAIAVGNPIKIISNRFSEVVISKMLKTKWWNLKEEELYLIEKHFFDVEEFLFSLEKN